MRNHDHTSAESDETSNQTCKIINETFYKKKQTNPACVLTELMKFGLISRSCLNYQEIVVRFQGFLICCAQTQREVIISTQIWHCVYHTLFKVKIAPVGVGTQVIADFICISQTQ